MCYCLVPLLQLTQAMINRSTSCETCEIPTITINAIDYYIIKFEETTASTFDNYRWYTQSQMQEIIGANQ